MSRPERRADDVRRAVIDDSDGDWIAGRRRPAPQQVLRRRRGSLASSPSASSISTATASSSPSRSRTTRARRSASSTPRSTAFLNAWNDAERKQAIVEELARQGVFLDELAEQVGRDFDAFDLVCHVAFDQPPLTRRERAEQVQKAQRLRQVRREGPRRSRSAARQVRRRRHQERRVAGNPQSRSAHRPSARRSRSSSSSAARQSYLAAIRELETAALPGSRLTHVQRFQPRQVHSGHHAQGRRHLRRRAAPRAARLDVVPQDLRRPREGARTAPRQLQVAAPAASALVRRGPRTKRASPATRCSTSSTTRCCPS